MARPTGISQSGNVDACACTGQTRPRHGYHLLSESGEDTLLKCHLCDYIANEEKAIGQIPLDIQNNDNIKKHYCLKNNIKLLEIPYWEFKNVENIIKEKLCL
jgi:prolyl-tRNA synthetase